MIAQTKDKNPNLQQRLQLFMHVLCADWGFCLPPEDVERISSLRPLTSDQFAIEVLRAEGFIPENEAQWRRKLRHRFSDQFGSEVIR